VVLVLIADDSNEMRDALTAVIEAEPDLQVISTASADEAVEAVVAHRPDVAILDVHMPGNGVVAARRIRRVAPGTKVIMLTGDTGALTRPDHDRLGLSAYLIKGVSNATLIATIRRAAGLPADLAGTPRP
jgi:DNA-binding NarL/FixJ family response regulator